jgi:hypothetical protein
MAKAQSSFAEKEMEAYGKERRLMSHFLKLFYILSKQQFNFIKFKHDPPPPTPMSYSIYVVQSLQIRM